MNATGLGVLSEVWVLPVHPTQRGSQTQGLDAKSRGRQDLLLWVHVKDSTQDPLRATTPNPPRATSPLHWLAETKSCGP